MSPTTLAIMENGFNILYLTTVWILVAFMFTRKNRVESKNQSIADLFALAFLLLASGDTFHVGGRVVTAILGAERAMVSIAGIQSSFIGIGMLATAYTMTVFYMVLAGARSLRRAGKGKPAFDGWFWFLQLALGTRLMIMALPGNAWEGSVPPMGMGLARNIPLMLAGFPLALLLIMEGSRERDKAWRGIGLAMLASYAFYTPVILFASRIPLLGLLMIPKTIAYVIMGLIAYRRYWKRG